MDEAKYRYWTKEYSEDLIEDVSDEMVVEYEEGVAGEVVNEFVVEEDYVMQLIEYWIDNYTMGNHKCKEIVDNLDYDIFEIDMEFGTRPDSWKQAGVWALDRAIHTNDNIEAIYKLTNEKLQKLWKK
jgi:flavin-binding protein dodecin